MWHVDVVATSSVMYATRTTRDVVSKLLEVDLDRLLEVVVQKCLLLSEYSKRLMRRRMM